LASLFKRQSKSKRYSKGYVWYAKYTENGKVTKVSLKTDSVQRARAKLAEIEDSLYKGTPVGHKKDTVVADFTPAYIKAITAAKQPHTVKTIAHEWKHFVAWAKPIKLGDVSHDDIIRYKAYLLGDRALAKSTTRSALLCLSAVFSFAIKEMGAFEGPNPVKGIKLPKPDERFPRYLSREEIDAVLAAAKAHSQDMHLIFAMGIYTGMRKNELLSARWSWVDFKKGGRILVQSEGRFRTKSGKDRVIPFHDRLRAILSDCEAGEGFILYPKHPEKSGASTKYRVVFDYAFKTVVTNAGVEWCTPHVMRHTFASWLAIEGVSLYKISQWMGHADLKTTQIYAHLEPMDEDINRL
jgi:integrase